MVNAVFPTDLHLFPLVTTSPDATLYHYRSFAFSATVGGVDVPVVPSLPHQQSARNGRGVPSVVLLLLVLASCGGGGGDGDTDPYERYLELAPPDAPHLSRDDAQARAFLGCGHDWAPGTVDAALATAYHELCGG